MTAARGFCSSAQPLAFIFVPFSSFETTDSSQRLCAYHESGPTSSLTFHRTYHAGLTHSKLLVATNTSNNLPYFCIRTPYPSAP
jgi:hypothetical protein